ncbi:MAG: hypothetical protein HC927_11665 [Deltaproteobacteria bacterium]|nr:hypothetical protein [Deltaproteobacteria bacterium]
MYTMAQCFLNAQPLFQAPSDFHEIGHYSLGGGIVGAEGMARCVAWHVRHWGRLAQKLESMIDLDGSTILDNTAMTLVFEGGYGYDPEGGTEVSSHSTENMIALIAGKAGGLNAIGGQHLVMPGAHPAQVINSAMAAVGVEEQLGEVSGTIDELFG